MIATFWPQFTPATKYWRCEVPARYMPAALADFDDEVFNGGPEAMMARQQGGTAIWQFVARPQRLDAMAWMAMHGNVRVLFECDDNYTLMPPDLPEPYKRKDFIKGMPAWDDNRSSVEIAKMAATNADGIITSTRFLAKRYQRLTCPYTFYCPNCVDLTMGEWPEADDHHKDDVFRVGFVGSASHWHDLDLITRALEWASKQDGVEVVTVGIEHPSWKHIKRRHIPPMPFEQYRHIFTLLDVSLAPIRPTEWSLSRSDNKVMEAALGGACSIVSNVEVFQDWIDEGCVSVTRQNRPKDFLAAVQYLVKHRDEARDMAATTRAIVEAERTIQGNIWRWQEACEPRVRTRTRKKQIAWYGNKELLAPFIEAAKDDGWVESNRYNHADIFLTDYPIQGWGERWQIADHVARTGGTTVETPHGGIPMLTYDGAVQIHPATKHSLVPAQGWADLYDTFGTGLETFVTGWSLCPVRPYQPLKKQPVNVLFAPAHPNSGDGNILDWLREANALGYKRLLEHAGPKLVRFYGNPAANGLGENPEPDVQYMQSDLRIASSLEVIEWADLVIGYGTFASLSLAMGKPTVVLEDPRPILDDGTQVSNTHADWIASWEYPAKVGDWGSFEQMVAGYRHQEYAVREWRDRFIGEPFDPSKVKDALEFIAYGARDRELIAA